MNDSRCERNFRQEINTTSFLYKERVGCRKAHFNMHICNRKRVVIAATKHIYIFFFLLTIPSSFMGIKLVFLNPQTMGFSKKIFPHLNKCSCLDNIKYFLERVFYFIFKVLFLKISTFMVGRGLIKTKSFPCFLLLFQICSVLVIPHQENRES